jgi:ribosomal protein S18 acetylase RimI-like enzyme
MDTTLYFLRSSEQKIVTDMLKYAYRLDELDKRVDKLDIYEKYYGLTRRDLGLYALNQNTLSGAAWIRLISEEKNPNAFVDENTPILTIALKPEFRSKGIGSLMLDQLLQEAGALYRQISVSVLHDSYAIKFFEKFGFERYRDILEKSPVDNSSTIIMTKQLSSKEVVRPSDGYDPSRWMD